MTDFRRFEFKKKSYLVTWRNRIYWKSFFGHNSAADCTISYSYKI